MGHAGWRPAPDAASADTIGSNPVGPNATGTDIEVPAGNAETTGPKRGVLLCESDERRGRGSSQGRLRVSPVTMRSRRLCASSGLSRARGSRRSRPLSTARSGPARRGGSGGSVASAVSVAIADDRAYGERPSTAAYSVAPSDHRSDSTVDVPSRARSGEMYCGEPMIRPGPGDRAVAAVERGQAEVGQHDPAVVGRSARCPA